jgi:hypothetical protein
MNAVMVAHVTAATSLVSRGSAAAQPRKRHGKKKAQPPGTPHGDGGSRHAWPPGDWSRPPSDSMAPTPGPPGQVGIVGPASTSSTTSARPVGTGPRPRHGDRGIRPVETLTLCSGEGVPSCGTGSRPRLGGFGVRVVVSVLSMGSMTSVPPAGTAIGRTSTLPGGRATTIRLAMTRQGGCGAVRRREIRSIPGRG